MHEMFRRGRLNLNSVQGCTNSLKEELRQTMLNQEVVFMKQVYELHRLYKVQLATMEDLKQKGLDNYSLHKGDVNLNSVNMYQNNQGKRSVAEFIQSENFNLQHEWCRLPGFTQKPLDLQLPADEFISYCANDLLGGGVHRVSLQRSTGSKNSSQGETVDNLRLSLGIGHDPGKKSGGHRVCTGQRTCAPSSDIIDLEDPEFFCADNDASPGLESGFAARNKYSKEKHQLESLSQSGTRNSFGIPPSISVVDIGPSSRKQASYDSGRKGKNKEILFCEFSSKNPTTAICKGNNIDLNYVQPEYSSYSSNHYSMALNLSPTTFTYGSKKVCPNSTILPFTTPTTWRNVNVSHCSETSERHQERDMDLNLTASSGEKYRQSGKDDKFREVDGGRISFVDLDSDPDEELCSSRSYPKIESVGSLSKLSNGQSCDMYVVDEAGAAASVDRAAEPPVPTYSRQKNHKAAEPPNCRKLSSSSESDCVIDHQSSSIKTMQSGVVSGEVNFSTSNESPKDSMVPPFAHSGEQDQRSSDSTESKIQGIVENKPKQDEGVQIAAELLVQISSEARACGLMKLAQKEIQTEEYENQPQCSSESYEAMALKAKENEADDFCVSSNAFVVDISEKKEIKYKLKRGTRMRDFQKDILPGLSILSRHEVREDINIMEGVIRSREYRKMRAKIGDGDDWCRPTRSKRSRASYSRRYCY